MMTIEKEVNNKMENKINQTQIDRLAELKLKDFDELTPAEKTELKELVKVEKESEEVK